MLDVLLKELRNPEAVSFLLVVTKSEIHDAAIGLPVDERIGLIAQLLDSVGVEHHEVDDSEVHRRKQEWDDGKIQGVSWDDVKRSCER